MREPLFRCIGYPDQCQHDRHFGEDADSGGQGGGARGAEEGHRHGYGEFKEIGGADHAGRSGDVKGELQQMGSAVGEEEDKEGLDGEGHCNEEDVQGIGKDDAGLGAEDNDQGEEKSCGGGVVEFMDENVVQIGLAPTPEDGVSGEDAAGQGDDHEEEDAYKEDVIGHGNFRNAEKKFHDGHKGDEDDQVVGGHLHHGVGRISPGEGAPYEDHGGAGGGAQKDGACQVLLGQGMGDKAGEEVEKEEGCYAVHGEGLDEPVRHPGDQQAPAVLSGLSDASEVHFNHHGVNHHPDEDGNGKGYAVDFQTAQKTGKGGKEMAQGHAQRHAEQYPQGEVALEETDALFFIGSMHDDHLLYK